MSRPIHTVAASLDTNDDTEDVGQTPSERVYEATEEAIASEILYLRRNCSEATLSSKMSGHVASQEVQHTAKQNTVSETSIDQRVERAVLHPRESQMEFGVGKGENVILTFDDRQQLTEALRSDDLRKMFEELGNMAADSCQTSMAKTEGKTETSETSISEEGRVPVTCIGGRVTQSTQEDAVQFTAGAMGRISRPSFEPQLSASDKQVHHGGTQTVSRPHAAPEITVQAHLHLHKNVTNIKVEDSSAVSVAGNLTVNSGMSEETSLQAQERLKALRVDTSKDLQTWTTGMVHTEAVDILLDQLSKRPSLYVLKGSPGEGKTTVAKMALKKLQDMGREVYIVNTPEEYFNVKTVKEGIILLNDIFGSSHFNLHNLSRWEPVFDDHLALEEHKDNLQQSTKSTVLLVTRSDVLKSASDHLGRFHSLFLKEDCVMDLTTDLSYTVEEKVQIWSYFANYYNVTVEERLVREVCEMELCHGFPHCCRLFSKMYLSNPKLKMKNFFSKPFEFLQLELKSVIKDIVAGPLLRGMLRNEGKYVVDPLEECTERSFQIKEVVDQYDGLYLRREKETITFHHPSVYDTVAFIVCKVDPAFVIQKCSLNFLNERVRIDGVTAFHTGHHTTVTIGGIYKQTLLNRLVEENGAGNISHVLSHDSFHDEYFAREFMDKVLFYVNGNLSKLVQETDKETKESFLFLCTKSKSDKLLRYVCEMTTMSKEDQTSALFGICRHSSVFSMQYFLNRYPHCDLSVRNERMQTLLVVAAQNPCDYILRTLIQRGVSVQEEDASGHTVLDYVCKYGVEKDASIVEMIVMNGGDVGKCATDRDPPLVTACSNGHASVVTSLIDNGADVNQTGKSGHTPLLIACVRGYNTLVTILLKRGADINNGQKNGLTPISAACCVGNNAVVTNLLDRGAGINKVEENGLTPLTVACERGQNTVVTTLLNRGAHLNTANEDGCTPLIVACGRGHNAIVTSLLKRKADIDKANKNGWTPLILACGRGHNTVVTTLLDRGADLNKDDNYGWTSLLFACYGGHNHVVTTLLDRGADVNQASSHCGWTPLIVASDQGHTTLVKTLLDRGADINKASKNGFTPLIVARAKGHKNVATSLLGQEAGINKAK